MIELVEGEPGILEMTKCHFQPASARPWMTGPGYGRYSKRAAMDG